MSYTQHVRFQFRIQNDNPKKVFKLLRHLQYYTAENDDDSIQVCDEFKLEGGVMKGALILIQDNDPLNDICRLVMGHLTPEDQRFAEVVHEDGSLNVIHSRNGIFTWYPASLVKMEEEVTPPAQLNPESLKISRNIQENYDWSPCCDRPDLVYVSPSKTLCTLRISEDGGVFAKASDTEYHGEEYLECLNCGTKSSDIHFDIF